MDRTSRTGVVVCILLLGYIYYFSLPKAKPTPATPPSAAATNIVATSPVAPGAPGTPAPAASPTPAAAKSAPEQLAFLENNEIRATFTSHGAAVKEVELKTHKEDKTGNVVLNEQAHSAILQLSGWPGADSLAFQSKQISGGLVYTATLPNGVTWERTYTLGKGYTLSVKDTLANPSTAAVVLPAYGMSVGRAEPLRVAGHYQSTANMYLGCGWLTNKAFHLTTINDFNPGYIPVIGIKTSSEKDAFASTVQDQTRIRSLAGLARRTSSSPCC